MTSLGQEELADVANKMRDPKTGIATADRRWLFKTYAKCFIGHEAVQWFINNKFVTNNEDAITLGNLLMKEKVFAHVTRDHVFKNENLYYRFKEDDDNIKKNVDDENLSWKDVLPDVSIFTNDANEVDLQPTAFHPHTDLLLCLDELKISPLDQYNSTLLDNVRPAKYVNPVPADGNYNMVVIGAGAAGLVTAAGAAGVGAKVAIIERHLMGGDCLNIGCVPSKALLRAAKSIAEVRNSKTLGVEITGEVKVNFPAIMERMRKLRAQISPNDSVRRFSQTLGIDVFIGQAKFISRDTVEVDGKKLKFARACIATGANAAVPPIPGLQEAGYLTNHTIFNLIQLPARFAIIGAGAIGCEMAQAFANFGAKTFLFNRSQRILGREDKDAAAVVEKSLVESGVNLVLGVKYVKVEKRKNEKILFIEKDGNTVEYIVDEILIAVGRKPIIEGLNLEAAGVEYDASVGVKVSDYLQTTNNNIYAAGDICTEFKFTHIADFMARIVIRNSLFFGHEKFSHLVIPWCTYTHPELAHVGLYEEDMKTRGMKYQTFTRYLAEVDRAILDGDNEGFVRFHVQEGSDTILGATIVAADAGNMISEITTAMSNKVGLGRMAAIIHPYPTQAEAIRQAGDMFNRTRLTPTVKLLFRKLLAARR